MALTVVRYRKNASGKTIEALPAVIDKRKLQQQQVQDINRKSIIKLDGGSTGLIINKIPATIKTTVKRPAAGVTNTNETSNRKYTLQTIASAGTPLTSFQWPHTIGGPGGTTITATSAVKKEQLGAAISSLPPNTIIQASSSTSASSAYQKLAADATQPTGGTSSMSTLTSSGTNLIVRRPTVFIKPTKRTIRHITLEMIEKNPYVHLGLRDNRLSIIKNVLCNTADITQLDCYLTLKKVRQNEDFAVLAEYFEMTESEAQEVFVRTIVKMSRYLRYLVRYPDSKKYYDRHKNLPFAFRPTLSHVQSLVECVDTDMHCPEQYDCNNYKFILSISTNGIIAYISEAYVGHHDDLTIINASDFKAHIPNYLSLFVDPGKAIRRKRKPKVTVTDTMDTDSTTDSADESVPDENETDENEEGRPMSKHTASRIAAEFASHQTMSIVNNQLTSRKVKDFAVPVMRVKEPVCRMQMSQMIQCLREFKVLQHYAIQEPVVFQYLNEVLIVVAGLINLSR